MKKTRIQKLSIVFLKSLFIVMCIVTLITIMQPDTAEEKAAAEQKIHERAVRVACIVGIKQRLKYPGSMEIKSRSVLNTGVNKWVAEIGIQAQNYFGVMVPSKFICIVCLENGEYQLETIRNKQ